MHYKFPATNNQAVNDLGFQFQKIMRSANRGSIKTRYRYAETGSRFVKWVSPTLRMQKIANMQDKHLIKYAQHLRERGCTDKYIKNELSGLRYIHSIIPNTRHQLSDSKEINKKAGLGSTKNNRAAEKNQAWTPQEVFKFADLTKTHNRPKDGLMMKITHKTGTRLEEISTLRTDTGEKAVKTGILHLVNTKGARPRDITIDSETKSLIREAMQGVPKGDYIFIPREVAVHKHIQSVKDYVLNHRDEIQDPTRVGDPSRSELHFHGIRHLYAQELYRSLIESGKDNIEARKELAEALGHSRIEITYVYVP